MTKINEKSPAAETPSPDPSTASPLPRRALDEPVPAILYPRSLRDRKRSPLSPDQFRKVAARFRRLYGQPLYAAPEYQPQTEGAPDAREDRRPIVLKLYPVFFVLGCPTEGVISERDLPIGREIHEASQVS